MLKPSEKVPLSAVRLGELLMEAGLPEGVFNIVHGDKECVDALLTHPLVRAISFVGSTDVAKYIYETGTRHGKRVQAAGGAKNHLIIMPDADLDQAVKAIQASAFGCAGERCMAGSVAVPVGKIGDPLVEGLVDVGRQDDGRPDRWRCERRHGSGDSRRASRQGRVSYLDIAAQEGAQRGARRPQTRFARRTAFCSAPAWSTR